jgi:hypothetical protein
MICWQTSAVAFLIAAGSPLAAVSQSDWSFVLSAAGSVAAAAMLALHAVTAWATAGFAETEPPDVLLELDAADVLLELGAAGALLLLLLLLPQPATNAPQTAASTTSVRNLVIMRSSS